MHKLLTYFSFLKPWEMTTLYWKNIGNKTTNRNYSALYDCRMIVLFQLSVNSDGRGKHMYSFLTILLFYFQCFPIQSGHEPKRYDFR
jgi:hypothetical protein